MATHLNASVDAAAVPDGLVLQMPSAEWRRVCLITYTRDAWVKLTFSPPSPPFLPQKEYK
ncbi:hypothetical protein IQ254_09075 [Nodosilinea sp. LEGE 07088]|uniref:hypothetical protein n=1 Tax=Nodosilinea sp. LEGE 07088 TaxID=2777968 RepID=UPI00188197E7|nr:hypothetical protein [Nodosilinea sp. LEGE 07088]MBE9137358.1 hypothetical protein [Nodosilinea sp. LEGE 07088]